MILCCTQQQINLIYLSEVLSNIGGALYFLPDRRGVHQACMYVPTWPKLDIICMYQHGLNYSTWPKLDIILSK